MEESSDGAEQFSRVQVISDEEAKQNIASARPHGDWWKQHVTLDMMSRGFKQQTLFYNPIIRWVTVFSVPRSKAPLTYC